MDKKIADLQHEIAIMQTACNAYANALDAALPQNTKPQSWPLGLNPSTANCGMVKSAVWDCKQKM